MRSRLALVLISAAMFFRPLAGLSAETLASSTAYERWPNALGLYFSGLAGNPGGGLHYQHWTGPLGLAVTGGGYFTPDPGSGFSILDYSVIVGAQYRVYGDDFSDWFSGQLYFWGQAGHIGYIKAADQPYIGDAIIAIGIGIETIWFEHFSFPIEFGYAAQFPNDTSIQFAYGGGLRYRY